MPDSDTTSAAPPSPSLDRSELLALMPFAVGLGITLDEATADRVVATLTWRPELCTAGGMLHGGATMALADTAGAVCAFLGLPPGASTVTTSSTTHLLRGVGGGTLHATAAPVHRGRTQALVQTDITDDRGRLIARTSQTQAIVTSTPTP